MKGAPFRKKGYKVTLSLKPEKLAKKRVTKALHVTDKKLHDKGGAFEAKPPSRRRSELTVH